MKMKNKTKYRILNFAIGFFKVVAILAWFVATIIIIPPLVHTWIMGGGWTDIPSWIMNIRTKL